MRGFTLVEILVAIAILGIASAVIIPNFRKFYEEQTLRNESLDLVQVLRNIQSNSQSRVRCSDANSSQKRSDTAGVTKWVVQFNSKAVYLAYDECEDTSIVPVTVIKSFNAGTTVDKIEAYEPRASPPDNLICSNATIAGDYIRIVFVNAGQLMEFSGAQTFPDTCFTDSRIKYLKIYLKNARSSRVEKIRVDKGGAIYAEN